jgi:dihydroxyacid dehydratase/phosphogluconate dehydratase
LAPGGAVAKITGKEGLEFTGKAKTFDTEDAFVEAVEKGEVKKGEKTVAVLRYLGPKGGPGEFVSHGISFSAWRHLLAWGLDLERIIHSCLSAP